MEYLVAGLVLGGIYAMVAAGLVVTYASTGVLNFAFGAEAYFVARLYYFLHTQHDWGVPAAAAASLAASPILGIVLYVLVFRSLGNASSLTKVVATVGLSVCLPPLAVIFFGNPVITSAPGLAPQPVEVVHVLGTALSLDQIIVLACVAALALIGIAVIRLTDVGMAMRAVVDSPALTAVSGTSPERIALGVWVSTTFLAGLTGILIAPIIGLTSAQNFTLVIASSFTAVIAGKLRNVGWAAAIGLLIGLIGGVLMRVVPSSSFWSSGSISSLPFVLTAIFVVYFAGTGQASEPAITGGALDRAVAVSDDAKRDARIDPRQHAAMSVRVSSEGAPATRIDFRSAMRVGDLGAVAILATVACLPLIIHGLWVGLIGLGLAYSLVFLSYTIITGEAGIISLCQITFAGLGGITAGQLATVYHWPVLLSVVFGGVIAVPLGLLVGAISLRLGDLYLALVTLTFGVLVDNLVFTLNRFSQLGAGVVISRPSLASSDRAFSYLCLFVFLVFALFAVNLRRSTTGLSVAAVRWGETAARTSGLRVVAVKVLLTAVAAFIAGVGGGMLALYNFDANPANYVTLGGLVWLAVLVTVGVRSVTGAALAGLAFAFIPALFTTYLPKSLDQVPIAAFGLGAVLVTRNPDGVAALHARQLRQVLGWVASRAPGFVRRRPVERSTFTPLPGIEGPTRSAEPAGSTRHAARQSDRCVLSANGVTVDFGGIRALSEVGLELGAGSIVGLVGPNGAGKSTLFDVLTGLRTPRSGTVWLDNVDVTTASPECRARLGLARTFQHPELFGDLTVADHLVFAHRVSHAPSRVWRDMILGGSLLPARAEEQVAIKGLLELLELGPVRDHPAKTLPLGTQRLVDMARALALDPSVLLLDEPGAGLNPHERAQLVMALESVMTERELTILLVEHDVDMVLGISDYVYVLDFGVCIAAGRPDQIRNNAAVVNAYLGESSEIDRASR